MKRVVQMDVVFNKGDILLCPRCSNDVSTDGLGKRWFHPQKHECTCGVVYIIEKGKVVYVG